MRPICGLPVTRDGFLKRKDWSGRRQVKSRQKRARGCRRKEEEERKRKEALKKRQEKWIQRAQQAAQARTQGQPIRNEEATRILREADEAHREAIGPQKVPTIVSSPAEDPVQRKLRLQKIAAQASQVAQRLRAAGIDPGPWSTEQRQAIADSLEKLPEHADAIKEALK